MIILLLLLGSAHADFDYVYESETKDTPEYDAQLEEILGRYSEPKDDVLDTYTYPAKEPGAVTQPVVFW